MIIYILKASKSNKVWFVLGKECEISNKKQGENKYTDYEIWQKKKCNYYPY